MDDITKAKEIIHKAEMQVQQNKIISGVGEIIVKELRPTFETLIWQIKDSVQQYLDGIKNIKIDVPSVSVTTPDVKVPDIKVPEVKVPEIKMPEVVVKVPEIKVPEAKVKVEIPEIKIPVIKVPKPEVTVKVPKIEIPELVWPDGTMPVAGEVSLYGINENNPLPVQLRGADGKPFKFPEISVSGGGRGVVKEKKPENIHIFNVDMALANIEYSQSLPSNTVSMTIQNRGDSDLRFSYNTGKVATSTVGFIVIKGGQAYYETTLNLSGRTAYFASENPGTVEIISYD
jgi:hypothetical protein